MKKFTFLIIFLFLKFKNCSEFDEECKRIIQDQGSPSDCCLYPVPASKNTPAEVCEKNTTNPCVHTDCAYEKLQLYTDGKVNKANMIQLFLHIFDLIKVPRGIWTEVVAQSVKTCESLGELGSIF